MSFTRADRLLLAGLAIGAFVLGALAFTWQLQASGDLALTCHGLRRVFAIKLALPLLGLGGIVVAVRHHASRRSVLTALACLAIGVFASVGLELQTDLHGLLNGGILDVPSYSPLGVQLAPDGSREVHLVRECHLFCHVFAVVAAPGASVGRRQEVCDSTGCEKDLSIAGDGPVAFTVEWNEPPRVIIDDSVRSKLGPLFLVH